MSNRSGAAFTAAYEVLGSVDENSMGFWFPIKLFNRLLLLTVFVGLVGGYLGSCRQAEGQISSTPKVNDQIDWQAMLTEHDMVWKRFPKHWYEGPFLGNGEQGTLLRQLDKKTLRWDVGCSAAHDHRPIDKDDLAEKNVAALNRGRLFIGHLKLVTPTNLASCDARLSQPNTFYSEIGLPVMETPLHGATAIQEMMLQSWGGRLRVFPAVPKKWPDVQFAGFRGEGGFLFSGNYVDGAAKWVLVQAENARVTEVDPQMENADWSASEGTTVEKTSAGVYQIKTQPGGTVLFWPKDTSALKPVLKPVKRRGKAYHFGLPGVKR